MITHVAGLFTHPQQEWKEIGETEESISHLYFLHVLFVALIPAVSAYIGTTRIGWAIGSRAPTLLTESSALAMSFLTYVVMLAGVWIMGVFIQWMSKTYDADPSLTRCIVFAAYTATPMFVAGLVMLYPSPALIMTVGIVAVSYTAYLLYTGVPIYLKVTEPAAAFVYASSILTAGLVLLVALMAATVVIWTMGIGPVYL